MANEHQPNSDDALQMRSKCMYNIFLQRIKCVEAGITVILKTYATITENITDECHI